MPHHPPYPGHLLFARNALTAAALILFGYRITRAVATGGHWEAATSLAAGLALIGATATGYLIHLREARRRAAIAERKIIALRSGLLEGDEDKALWDSIDAEEPADNEDTIPFGTKVVLLRRYRKAG